jgi:hypothetical protein
VAVNYLLKQNILSQILFWGGEGEKCAQKMNKLKNEFFFLKNSQKFTKTAYNMLYKHLLLDLQNIQRIAIGYINQLGSQKI